LSGLSNRNDLGVGGGVLECFSLVVGHPNRSVLVNDDGADRHFIFLKSLLGLIKGDTHPHVVRLQNVR
jgi:hypothetical protein